MEESETRHHVDVLSIACATAHESWPSDIILPGLRDLIVRLHPGKAVVDGGVLNLESSIWNKRRSSGWTLRRAATR